MLRERDGDRYVDGIHRFASGTVPVRYGVRKPNGGKARELLTGLLGSGLPFRRILESPLVPQSERLRASDRKELLRNARPFELVCRNSVLGRVQ